jgi:hypothetical protein
MPATQFSSGFAGGSRVMRTFSGRNATHTVSPGLASAHASPRSRPAFSLATAVPGTSAATTRPSIRLTSPMKSATQREFGSS